MAANHVAFPFPSTPLDSPPLVDWEVFYGAASEKRAHELDAMIDDTNSTMQSNRGLQGRDSSLCQAGGACLSQSYSLTSSNRLTPSATAPHRAHQCAPCASSPLWLSAKNTY